MSDNLMGASRFYERSQRREIKGFDCYYDEKDGVIYIYHPDIHNGDLLVAYFTADGDNKGFIQADVTINGHDVMVEIEDVYPKRIKADPNDRQSDEYWCRPIALAIVNEIKKIGWIYMDL